MNFSRLPTRSLKRFFYLGLFLTLWVTAIAPAYAAGTTTLFVDVGSNYWLFGQQPRDYDYSSGSAPKSSWGTSSKPYTDIQSAIEAAGHDDFDKVIIKFCDSDPTWYTSGYSKFYNVTTDEIDLRDMTVEVKPMSTCSRSNITHQPLTVPSSAQLSEIIFNGLKFDDSAGSFAWMLHTESNDIDIEIKNNTFKDATIFAENSAGYYDAGTSFTVTNNTATGARPSGAPSTDPAWLAFTDIGGTITVEGNTCSMGWCVYAKGSDLASVTGNSFSGSIPSGGSLYVADADVETIANNTFGSEGGATLLRGDFSSITGNDFVAPSGTSGGLYIAEGTSDEITLNDFTGYPRSIFLGDTTVSTLSENTFSASSSSGAYGQIMLSGGTGGGSTIDLFEKNTFTGPGTALNTGALFLGVGSMITTLQDNTYSQFKRGIWVADSSQVGTLQRDRFSNMTYAIVNNGSLSWIATIDSVQISSSHEGIVNLARIGTITNSDFLYTDIGIHFTDGGSGTLIQGNLFSEFSEGILIESDTGEFDFFEGGSGDYDDTHFTSGGGLDILQNTFTQQEINLDAVAIATAFASINHVQLNTVENTGRFLVGYDSSLADLIGNSALPGVASFSSPYGAVELTRANTFPIEGNVFYDASGIPSALFEHTVKAQDTALNVEANPMLSNQSDLFVELTDRTKIFSTLISNNTFLGSPEAIVIHENDANGHTVRIEKNSFNGSVAAITVDGTATTGGELSVFDNTFANLTTGLLATSPDLHVYVENSTFDSMTKGAVLDGVGTVESINKNTFTSVDAPISIAGGGATTVVQDISSNEIDGADTAISIEGVTFTYPSSYGGNIYNNVLAKNRAAIHVVDSTTTDSYLGIQNNSFDSNDFDVVIEGFDSAKLWVLRNNVFSKLSSSLPVLTDDTTPAVMDNNLYRTTDTVTDTVLVLYSGTGDILTDTAGWTSYTLDTLDAYAPSVLSNLILEWLADSYQSPSTGNYQLNYASFGLDRAYGNPTYDISGTARPEGAGPDLGAYEMTVTVDADSDSLWAESESAWGADDGTADVDGDGLLDGEETVTYNTSPIDADSDGDGVDDTTEIFVDHTDPLDALDYATPTDTDGDGYADSLDAFPTDPTEWADGDSDGVGDNSDLCPTEDASGYDADADGCIDAVYLDSDGDGLNDAEEVGYGTDPYDDDTDADGMDDGWEVDYSFDPVSTDESADDEESDGLTNLQEYTYGTDPYNLDATAYHDTDGDGSFGVTYGAGANVAYGATVTSGVYEDPTYSYPASNLVDEDTATLAYPASATLDYAIDLGTDYNLESVFLYWGYYGLSTSSDRFTSWELTATLTDGTEVILASESSNPAAAISLVYLSTAAQSLPIESLQLTGTGSGWIGLYELYAYER